MIPYEWKRDLEKNRTGANVHNSIGVESTLFCLLDMLVTYQKRGDEGKVKETEGRINSALEKAFKKGLTSYKYTYTA